MIINSFFTNLGIPATGLTPSIRIWEVGELSHTLVVTDAPMIEIGDGFYKYVFSTYDPTKKYVTRSDGGVLLPDAERYQVGATEEIQLEDNMVVDIVNGVWDADTSSHLTAGSTGLMLAEIKADTASISISVTTINSLVQTLLKYERNRTRIDTTARTLTVYDDDCVTPLHVFNLKDSSGNPSVAEVCERAPTTCP